MDRYRQLKITFSVLRTLVEPFFKKRLGYTYDSLKDIDGPYLLLCNHVTDYDPIMVGMAAHNQIYFVAGENVLQKGFVSKLLRRAFDPIIHYKGRQGAQSAANILRTLRDGHSVMLFPEGNRTFDGVTMDIPEVTGKLARRCGARVITYRLEGGYYMQPRWGTTLRHGRIRGRLVHVYEPDDMKAMTDHEMLEAIVRDLHENAYERQADAAPDTVYTGKHLAYGLESTVFACPYCHQMGGLHSDDDCLYCDCGRKLNYNERGQLTDEQGVAHSIRELNLLQKKLLASASEISFSDTVVLCHVDEIEHVIDRQSPGRLAVEGFEYATFTPDGSSEIRIPLDDVSGVAIFSRNKLIVHLADSGQNAESVQNSGSDKTGNKGPGHYELHGNTGFNALKYMYLYELVVEKRRK